MKREQEKIYAFTVHAKLIQNTERTLRVNTMQQSNFFSKAKNLDRLSTKEDIEMAKKYIKRSSLL